jgi:predicted MPP superfamily phosphohydrolase
MKVVALYDIHGNLFALEAVLREVRDARVDLIVVGGDVLPGPMPRETLACLMPSTFLFGSFTVTVIGSLLPTWLAETSAKYLRRSAR